MRWLLTACLVASFASPLFAQGVTAVEGEAGVITVENNFYAVTHDPARGGSITSITIKAGAKTVPVEMTDRIAQGGDGFLLVRDDAPVISIDRSGGAKQIVVNVAARYIGHPDHRDSAPRVHYRYTYTIGSPLVRIDVDIPQQVATQRFDRLEQFVFNLGGEKPFDKLGPLVTGGDGSIMPATFGWSACEARPSAGVLYRDDASAFAVITPTAGSFRLDTEAMHVQSRGFLNGWLGRQVTSGATLYLGPASQIEETIAHASPRGVREDPRDVWRATFMDPKTKAWHAACGRIADAKSDGATMTWENLAVGPGRITVTARLTDPDSTGPGAGRLSITQHDENLTVWEVEFPVVRFAAPRDPDEADFLVMPYKAGARLPNPTAAGLWEIDYPGSAGWPFMVYWRPGKGGGLYMGAHDPQAGVKTVRSLPTGDGTLELSFIHPAANAGAAGNGFTMDYDVVVGRFAGNFRGWYDGMMIYRDWMVKQEWFPQKPLHANDDVPQWLKDVVVATRRSGGPTGLRNSIEHHENSDFKEYHVGVFEEHDILGRPPTLLWWYHAWFGGRDDHEKFHYAPQWPAPPDFAQGVDKCKARGINVISYSLNRWWGYENEAWKKKGAEKAVLIRSDGSPWIYTRRNVGIMCYGTQLYQQEMQDVMRLLLSQGDVDGTYFDLGGTSGDVACFATDHGHATGTGAWVTTEHRNLMASMRAAGREKNDDFIVVMEGNADCYLTAVDGYALFESSVPLRQALYGDYLRSAGQKRTTWERSPLEAVNPAKHFAWGCPIGRFVSSELNRRDQWNEPAVKYFKRLAQHKWCARPWLNLGRMMHPFDVTDLSPAGPRELSPDTLMPHAAWQAPDGSIAFVFANARYSTAASFTWQIDPAAYGIPTDGSWGLYQLEPSDQPPAPVWTKLGDIGATIQRNETISEGSTLILVAKPNP